MTNEDHHRSAKALIIAAADKSGLLRKSPICFGFPISILGKGTAAPHVSYCID